MKPHHLTPLLAALLFAGCETQPVPPLRYPASFTPPLPSASDIHPTPLPTDLLHTGDGYLIGQLPTQTDPAAASRASQQAQQTPATPEQARHSPTADLNQDGFVTLDEVVALRDAGLDDHEITRRLLATHQVFALTANQEDYLINRGVSRTVVDRLHTLNPPAATQPH